MDNYNNPQYHINHMYEDMNDVFSTRFDRYDNRFDNRFDNRNNNRFDNYYDYNQMYDRRYDRNFDDRMRYYRYPYCDSYGRCENPIWWMFWPLFFL